MSTVRVRAQAVVSLRPRGKGQRRVSVVDELKAEGVTLKFSDSELEAIIELDQNGLRWSERRLRRGDSALRPTVTFHKNPSIFIHA